MVEDDDDEEGDEEGVARDNEGETDDWTYMSASACSVVGGKRIIRREWKMTPASRTLIFTISVLGEWCPWSPCEWEAALAACHCTSRIPRYSTRKERKMPAMRMAAAVDSYESSPRHSLRNMSVAWVNSWWR